VDNILRPLVNRLPVAYDYFSFEFKAKKFISGLNFSELERNQVWLGSYPPAEQSKLFSQDMRVLTKGINPFDPIYEITGSVKSSDLIAQILMTDISLYLPGDILTLVDRASMSTSLECRVPFLDQELVEFAVNIPTHLKLKGTTSKYILKKSMEKILPKAISKRKKVG